jgi:tetratricopeptide (TPR) repeat protein
LARSTARLGHDGPANALFARLGKDALSAEDYFLLAQGLNRVGQGDAAVGLWEKALADDPRHSEALEALARTYTARNRLVEAAQLYDRLSKTSGWELRGELSHAGLLFELNDPAGAVAILEQALKRSISPDVKPEILSRYRKLLVHSLLRTERAAQARPELDRLLESAPDAESWWLLSRAHLQKGEKQAAEAALAQADGYRAENPLELEAGPYVGENRCAECHREIFRAYESSRFTTTLQRGRQLLDLPYPDKPIPDPADPKVTHSFPRKGDLVHFETAIDGKTLSAIVDYAFGSPERYVSLVGHDANGRAHVLRLSHYRDGTHGAGWVRTTGHTADAEGGHDFLGKPLSVADGVLKCLFCHTTNPHSILSNSGPESRDRAIGCERCHGPGSNHLKAVAARLSDMAIVSPAQGSGEGSIRLCAQCHALHQEMNLPRSDPYWARFQGTTLTWSKCFTESQGAFDCVTCHDPHRNAERSAAHYEAKCLSCHSDASIPEAAAKERKSSPSASRVATACPVDPKTGCIGCHMPPVRSEPLHATFADHYIRIHPDTKPGA